MADTPIDETILLRDEPRGEAAGGARSPTCTVLNEASAEGHAPALTRRWRYRAILLLFFGSLDVTSRTPRIISLARDGGGAGVHGRLGRGLHLTERRLFPPSLEQMLAFGLGFCALGHHRY